MFTGLDEFCRIEFYSPSFPHPLRLSPIRRPLHRLVFASLASFRTWPKNPLPLVRLLSFLPSPARCNRYVRLTTTAGHRACRHENERDERTVSIVYSRTRPELPGIVSRVFHGRKAWNFYNRHFSMRFIFLLLRRRGNARFSFEFFPAFDTRCIDDIGPPPPLLFFF